MIISTTKYDNILAGTFPIVKESVTIGKSQTLEAGALLGKKTAAASAVARKTSVTFSGTSASGSAAATLDVDGKDYPFATTSGDTAAAVASGIAALVNADADAVVSAAAANGKLTLTFKAAGYAANAVQVSVAVTDSAITAGAVSDDVVGLDANDGEYVLCDSSVSDGSQKPAAILLEPVTTGTDETAGAVVGLTGEYNENKMTFGGSDTAETHRAALRVLGIFLKTNVSVAE